MHPNYTVDNCLFFFFFLDEMKLEIGSLGFEKDLRVKVGSAGWRLEVELELENIRSRYMFLVYIERPNQNSKIYFSYNYADLALPK